MSQIVCYLTFNGQCRKAMTFYHQCLGGEIQIQSFEESGQPIDAEFKHWIMHANIHSNGLVLMASDNMPGTPDVVFGNNFSLSIDCANEEEQSRLFNALAEGGKITMPLQDTFWGARFGMLDDQFGIAWMFNYDKK